MLHRNLTQGWKDALKKAYDEINHGVSARELELAMSKHGKDISDFKDFIMDNSKPLPKGKIDMFELVEWMLESLEADEENAELNEDGFIEIVREYLKEKHHEWNDTVHEKIK